MGPFAIHTEQLTRTFNTVTNTVTAVESLNLTIATGTAHALVGEASAGKTTALRLLLGLIAPTSGQGTVLGYDIRTQSDQIRRHTGAVFADAGLYPRLTVAENLDFYGRIWHMRARERRSRMHDVLTRLELWEHRDQPVRRLVDFQRRKLSLGRSIFHRPALLMVDELTLDLPQPAAAALQADIGRLVAHEGVGLLLATRSLKEAEILCTELTVLEKGRTLATGPIQSLRTHQGSPTLEIIGRGFDEHVITLLSRRSEVAAIKRLPNRLLLQLHGHFDTAPLVSLLVEASVDIEQVHKHALGLDALLVALGREEPVETSRPPALNNH